ncbi:MAG: zf-HC2 domain-containing protein [Ruminococcaceae bacterium]|nr:zf-HC2 domain-containing protein [Oscillospiraceae bacterium]
MDCNIILDLIPLYIDECCSEQSAAIVKEHINTCEECRAVYESMNTSSQIEAPVLPAKTPQRVNYWKASVLQSVLLFSSFAAITLGVALEAASPLGLFNGIWAFNLVIPATGFLLRSQTGTL